MSSESNVATRQENSTTIQSFVQQLAREYFMDFPDRRTESRYRLTVPVEVLRADDEGNATGEPLRAITRDLSTNGIGLVSQDPVDGRLIVQVVSPSGKELCAIAEVMRCEPNGYYFDIGCRFLRTL